MDIKKILSDWGVNAIALMAGTIGGLIAIVLSDQDISFRSAVAQILCAIAFSGYGAERVAIWLNWQNNPSACGLLGLCLGISGLLLARGVINMGKRFAKDPVKFIKTKGGNDDVASN